MQHSRSFLRNNDNESTSAHENQLPTLIDVPLSYDNVLVQEESLTNDSEEDMNVENNVVTTMDNQDDEQERSSLSFRADDVDEGILICLSQEMMGHTSDNESAAKDENKPEIKQAPEKIVVETVEELDASELRASQQMDEIRANAVILLGRADEAHENDFHSSTKEEGCDLDTEPLAVEPKTTTNDDKSMKGEAKEEIKNVTETNEKEAKTEATPVASKMRFVSCRLLVGLLLFCFVGFGSVSLYQAVGGGLTTFQSFQDEAVTSIDIDETVSPMMAADSSMPKLSTSGTSTAPPSFPLELRQIGDRTISNASIASEVSLVEMVLEESHEESNGPKQDNKSGAYVMCICFFLISAFFAKSRSSIPQERSIKLMKPLGTYENLLQFQKSFKPTGKGRKSKYLRQKVEYPMSYEKLTMSELALILSGLSPDLKSQSIARLSKLERIARIHKAYCRVLLTLTKVQLHTLLNCKKVSYKGHTPKSELLAAAAQVGFA